MADLERAVSTTLSYALTLTIVTLLISGIFIGMEDFVTDQRERAIRSELEVIGHRIAADIAAVDRMALAADTGTARLSTTLPTTVAGRSYRIEITDPADGPHRIDLSTSDPAVTVTVEVKTGTDLVETTVSGGDVTITYDGTDLEVARD